MTKATYKRMHLIWWWFQRVHDGRVKGRPRSHGLIHNTKQRKRNPLRLLKPQRLSPSDTPLPTKPHFLMPPKQFFRLGIKDSNPRSLWGVFSFKPPLLGSGYLLPSFLIVASSSKGNLCLPQWTWGTEVLPLLWHRLMQPQEKQNGSNLFPFHPSDVTQTLVYWDLCQTHWCLHSRLSPRLERKEKHVPTFQTKPSLILFSHLITSVAEGSQGPRKTVSIWFAYSPWWLQSPLSNR